MHHTFVQALQLLHIDNIQLQNEHGEQGTTVSAQSHADALFSYLHMAGYLSHEMLAKSVDYLAAAKPFSVDTEIVKTALITAYQSSIQETLFNPDIFFERFAQEDFFSVNDLIDLITFLQQTAFDREYGVERDRLQAGSWLKVCQSEFVACATQLGVITPLPPLQEHYLGVAIMGASIPRVKTRFDYFKQLKVHYELALGLTGQRELSIGLDDEKIGRPDYPNEMMEKVAKSMNIPISYVEKPSGTDKRIFLDGVTETMMVNYFIRELCPEKQITLVDSAVQVGHWRATSAQNAIDMAPMIIEKIGHVAGYYHFSIIAEQPYAGRMAMQVQRAFNQKIRELHLEETISITVEGCGAGISIAGLTDLNVLKNINSELGALMAERFYDARSSLLAVDPHLICRDPKFILFSKRNEAFKKHAYLRDYVSQTYPRLLPFLTDKQYEQINWINTTHQTNERLPNPSALPFQQQRIFARLHFLNLLRQGGLEAHQHFVQGQNEPQLTAEHFYELSGYIRKLSDAHYQQLWVATLTSMSVEANKRASAELGQAMPFDAVDFLAQVMTSEKVNAIYPASSELAEKDAFPIMFNTGHFRHMMYVEGGRNMFDALRQKIKEKQFEQEQLDLWFSYWLIDLTGFRAQTKELGSVYLNDHTFNAMITIKRHLNRLIQNPDVDILADYLNERADWLGLASENDSVLFPPHFPAPRFILARIGALLRLFAPHEGQALLRGLAELKNTLGDDAYAQLIDTLNPLQDMDEPTPTFGPALLANLQAESHSYERAILVGLPIYAQALEAYRHLRREGMIEKAVPLNLNGLAEKSTIQALLNGEIFSVLIDSVTGTARLEQRRLEDQATCTTQLQ